MSIFRFLTWSLASASMRLRLALPRPLQVWERTIYWAALLGAFCGHVHASTLLICGVAKDCDRGIPYLIQNAEELGSHFDDYRVVIYENNSSDHTPALLHQWARQNPHVTAITERLSKQQLDAITQCHSRIGKPCRIERLAYARNRLLDSIREMGLHHTDFTIVVDADFECAWPIEEILKAVQKTDWDCVSSFGVFTSKDRYYDMYALRDELLPLGPEFLGESWWRWRLHHLPTYTADEPWIPVMSGFGGLAMYRSEALFSARYSAYVTQELLEDATRLVKHSHHAARLLRTLSHSTIPQPKCNSGYAPLPIVCEHVPLHAEMRLNGFDRIYINPAMRMHWKTSKQQAEDRLLNHH